MLGGGIRLRARMVQPWYGILLDGIASVFSLFGVLSLGWRFDALNLVNVVVRFRSGMRG